jgi:hypothetical protein
MGLLDSLKPAAGSEPDGKSGATTVVPSQNVSNTDLDKQAMAGKSSSSSETESPKKGETDLRSSAEASSNGQAVDVLDEKNPLEGAESVPADEVDVIYPSGLKLGLITLALCLSVFLVALDNTIIATAIPKITDHFNSLGDVGWYGSAYLLTTCALQLFFGK